MEIPFVGPSYTQRSTNLNAQRTLNWYLEQAPEGKSPVALMPRPGLSSFASIGSNGLRGSIVYDDVGYVVSGAGFYLVQSDGTVTLKGNLITSSGQVGMAAGGDEVMVVDGTYGYSYAVSSATFNQIVDTDFPAADAVDFTSGLFIVNQTGTGRMYCSGSYDALTWGASDFSTAESNPDDIIRVVADHDELVAFGRSSTEFWYYDGGAGFPFAKVAGATLGRGCAAAFSVVKLDNSVFWLGDDGVVYRLSGRSPVRVSTHAVEAAIADYSLISDAYAFTFDWDGHKFYVLTFPTGNGTWVFDVATGAWCEFGTFGVGRWAISTAFRLGTKTIVGDELTGELYQLDAGTYTDNGTAIERVRDAQVIHQDQKRVVHRRLEVEFEGGVGLISGQGSAPVVMLSWSDDGGHNFGNEIYGSLGAQGSYGTRAVFNRLGMSRNRVYRVRITDPVKTVLIGARGDFGSAAH